VLLCGKGERWSVAQLASAIKFDHGYTPTSPPVQALLEVLAELEPPDQRRFLRFVTGCPRLPPGGIGALQPRLTVVRKHPTAAAAAAAATASGDGGGTPSGGGELSVVALLADGDLPSVMTCANYIKLPPYSSKGVMRERILFAIREGQGSFDLS
jgi:E3 ubiquitin-protein ligase TRIP12